MDLLELIFIDCLVAGPRWSETLGAFSSLALACTAVVGVFVAYKIPQRISDNEQQERRAQLKRTSSAIKVVLSEEIAWLASYIMVRCETTKEAMEKSEAFDENESFQNPLESFRESPHSSDMLIAKPEHWLRYVAPQITRAIVSATREYSTWEQVYSHARSVEKITRGSLKDLEEFSTVAIKALKEAHQLINPDTH